MWAVSIRSTVLVIASTVYLVSEWASGHQTQRGTRLLHICLKCFCRVELELWSWLHYPENIKSEEIQTLFNFSTLWWATFESRMLFGGSAACHASSVWVCMCEQWVMHGTLTLSTQIPPPPTSSRGSCSCSTAARDPSLASQRVCWNVQPSLRYRCQEPRWQE